MPIWNERVLDAGMSGDEGPLCFCPIEGDIDGEFTVVTGMNLLANRPDGRLVAIVHEDGQDAVEEWLVRNRHRVAHLDSEEGD